MRGFCVNQRIFSRDSDKLQKVCFELHNAILKMERYRVDVPIIGYFITSILPEIQIELYNYDEFETLSEVLDIVVDSIKHLNKEMPTNLEDVYFEVISRNSSRSDETGAFFAQLFNNLTAEFDFQGEYDKLDRIISDNDGAYFIHTKHQILRRAFENIRFSPEDAYLGIPEVELLVSGTRQKDIFIQTYATCTLARLCQIEGIPQDLRFYMFQKAVDGVKLIPWDYYFDRNQDQIPEEVGYLAIAIDFVADAEETCRALGLDVDLAEDSQFVRIFSLLLMRGFDFEVASRFPDPN